MAALTKKIDFVGFIMVERFLMYVLSGKCAIVCRM